MWAEGGAPYRVPMNSGRAGRCHGNSASVLQCGKASGWYSCSTASEHGTKTPQTPSAMAFGLPIVQAPRRAASNQRQMPARTPSPPWSSRRADTRTARCAPVTQLVQPASSATVLNGRLNGARQGGAVREELNLDGYPACRTPPGTRLVPNYTHGIRTRSTSAPQSAS